MTKKIYDFDAIKDAVTLSEVIQRYIVIKRVGREFSACCPFHGENTPSFTVNDEKAFWHCFGCGGHGDVIDFVMHIEPCDTRAAINKIVGDDFTVSDESLEQIRAKRQQAQAENDALRARVIADCAKRWEELEPADEHPYLERKGIEPHMARIDGKMLAVPVYDRHGEIQSIQRIATKKNEEGKDKFFPKNATVTGGRLNFGICIGRTIVCEGFATGASIYEAIPDRVAVGFSKFGMIALVRELRGNGQDVAIASDRNALPEMMPLGKELGIPVFVPPEGHDDFNDMAVAMQGEGKDPTPAIKAIFDGPGLMQDDAPQAKEPPSPANDDPLDPVDIWARNEAPPMPRNLLPPIIERMARNMSTLTGADAGGFAMGALTVCAAAITDRIQIKVKRHEDWTESARIWCMMIGEPSYKKSPIMKAVTRRLGALDGELVREYHIAEQKFKEDDSGEPPIPKRHRIDDVTMEAAAIVCHHSPDGILAMQDELSGWFGGIEKYAGGKSSAKDRAFWLRAFGGGHYAVDRVGRKSFLVENLSICVYGGVQPDAIRRIMSDATDDGLIQRFFPVVLRPADLGTDDAPSEALRDFDDLVTRLTQIKPPQNWMQQDIVLTFDDEAMRLREELERKHHGMVRAMEGVNKKMASHLGKYDGMFPRLCLIWHVIENANLDALPEVIPHATASRAAKFLHEYIMRHSMAFYTSTIGMTEDQDIIEDVAGYIIAREQKKVTLSTFHKGSSRMRKLTRDDIKPLCEQLEAFGWITEIDARNTQFICKVNPRVHEIFGERAEAERVRRDDQQTQIKSIVSGKA